MAIVTHDFVVGDTLPTLQAKCLDLDGVVVSNLGDSGISAVLRFRTVELPSRAKGSIQSKAMTPAADIATSGIFTYQWAAADFPAFGKGVKSYEVESEVRITDSSGKFMTSLDVQTFTVRHSLGDE